MRKIGKKKRKFVDLIRWQGNNPIEPLYNDKADYNTNAKSFYDYLARFNKFIHVMVDAINRALRKDFTATSTITIEAIKTGKWIDYDDDTSCEKYDDIVDIKFNVIFSKVYTETFESPFPNVTPTVVPNGSKEVPDGLWSPDYRDALVKAFNFIQQKFEEIDGRLDIIEEDIRFIKNELTRIEQKVDKNYNEFLETQGGLQKIINNLYETGAITNNNINNYEFVVGRNIASGTINYFAGADQSNYFIRTNSGSTERDIIAGIGVG